MVKEATTGAIPVCHNRDALVDAGEPIRTAVLVIHGSARNAATSQAAVERAAAESGSRGVLVVAPQFLTNDD